MMEADLMFDVLLYINMYYFPVFLVSETGVTIAKYIMIHKSSAQNSTNDYIVMGIMLSSELLKLILFRKLRYTRKVLANTFALFGTIITTTGLLYVFVLESLVLKMEYMVCVILFCLLVTEIFYGLLQYTSCCRKTELL